MSKVATASGSDRSSYWREQIKAWQASGQSQTAYCKANNINYPRFIYWLSKFRKQLTAVPSKKTTDFVPVTWPSPSQQSSLSLSFSSGLELRGISADNIALVERLARCLT